MPVEVKLRRWGSSLGCVIPKEVVEKQRLKEDDVVLVAFVKKGDLSDLFGTLKTDMTGQQVKDMARKGWK